LSLFFAAASLVTLAIFFFLARRSSGTMLAVTCTLLALPLIVFRLEIRPEVFSYLFLGIYFYCLREKKALKWLPVLQIFWVNLHLFFIFGPFLIFVFMWRENALRPVFLASCAACLVNPHFLAGALAPLMIFRDFGYMLAENQSVFFMQQRFHDYVYLHFEWIAAIAAMTFAFLFRRRNFEEFVLLVFFGLLAFRVNRALPLFGYFFIPIVSGNLAAVATWQWTRILLLFLALILTARKLHPRLSQPYFGLGLLDGSEASANFFSGNHLRGPIFNNYDIGGYLIFHLFPAERVFVDNRPEAYPSYFFRNTYVPMQEDENVWQNISRDYGFNAIYFYRRDMTPWAQPFLIRRLQDPAWAPVFVDEATIIFLKRNEQNAELIRRYELPKSMFRISK
jgi:hypothetical protein